MRRSTAAFAVPLLSCVLISCADPGGTTAPVGFASVNHSEHVQAKTIRVVMTDDCDAPSFNEMIGPGTCTRPRRATRFFTFVNQLVQTQDAPKWRNIPLSFKAQFGDAISARNDGFEVHTYTPVAVFGGGLDPTLNQLSGNPIPAPECFLLGDADFALPGQSSVHDANVHGTMNFQCCIHPWMRATATVN